MSKYTVSRLLFIITLFVLILLVQYNGASAWILMVPFVIFVAVLIVGSAAIGFNFYFHSLCRSTTTEKIVALTFDDGPDRDSTRRLIDILEAYQAPAAFFCIGSKVEAHPEIVRLLDEKGHLVGNHSFTHHRLFDLFSARRMADEISKTNRAIEKAIGKSPLLFRPPYGVTNPQLKRAVHSVQMVSAGWSLRSFDTVRSKDKVMKKLRTRTGPGKVILFHDTGPATSEIVTEYLEWLRSDGYKIVSLDQMFNVHAYANK